MAKIKKGDQVVVTSGASKGKKGTIARVLPKENKVLIEGVNVKKVHSKKGKKGSTKGQIIERALPIHVSNVMIQDGSTVSRVGFSTTGDTKVRVAKKSGKTIK